MPASDASTPGKPRLTRKPLHMIVACSENRVIGRAGTLPWRIKEDLHYLFEMVKGGVVIEGRRVFDELKRPYPGTRTIVLSRYPARTFDGCDKAGDLDTALRMADAIDGFDTIWIGGGQGLYEEALPLIDRLYLTLVHTEVPDGDTFFPEWRKRFTKVVSSRRSTNGKLDYTFLVLEPG